MTFSELLPGRNYDVQLQVDASVIDPDSISFETPDVRDQVSP